MARTRQPPHQFAERTKLIPLSAEMSYDGKRGPGVAVIPPREEVMPDKPDRTVPSPVVHNATPPVKAGGDPPKFDRTGYVFKHVVATLGEASLNDIALVLLSQQQMLRQLDDDTFKAAYSAYHREYLRRRRSKANE